jgi:2-C-methyl-D-erythritol 2,4-cyclodiphosphate synthase
MTRIGLGYDIHRLVEGRRLLLGGIELPFEKGEDGHSDGDVLFHAIMDAVLGAAGLGDIGSFFPPEDAKWKDADSAALLQTVMEKVYSAGWKIENLDCVVKLEKPKFIPYRQQVIESIASVLEVSADRVFVKAKTGEKLGKIGRGEAIEAWVTCLISREKKRG